MSCNCEPKKYSIGMGCCVPVLAPIENYYTKHQIDEMLEEIESGETSGCCITPEEVDEKIDSATSGIDQNIDAISGDVITISGDLQAVSAEVESISGLTSGDVQTMIDESVSGKQDTLIAGDNITIVNNVISAVSGGSGISSAQVQTMIDESISGKADSDDVYLKNETSSKTEISDSQAAQDVKINAISAATQTIIENKPNFWCGDETAWSQISGSTSADTLYLIY